MTRHRSSILLPTRYLAALEYYAALSQADEVYIDPTARYDKRDKATHRATIADANGVIRLTVPVEKPQSLSRATIADIRISAHDQWWQIHFTALASAYGRTPYFEYYADDFKPFYSPQWVGRPLIDYDTELMALVCRLLHIDTRIIIAPPPEGVDVAMPDLTTYPAVPYYQVRAHRQGFIPSLSIADLLFNLGPEGLLLLDSMGGSQGR